MLYVVFSWGSVWAYIWERKQRKSCDPKPKELHLIPTNHNRAQSNHDYSMGIRNVNPFNDQWKQWRWRLDGDNG
jgi:hypothetical protein